MSSSVAAITAATTMPPNSLGPLYACDANGKCARWADREYTASQIGDHAARWMQVNHTFPSGEWGSATGFTLSACVILAMAFLLAAGSLLGHSMAEQQSMPCPIWDAVERTLPLLLVLVTAQLVGALLLFFGGMYALQDVRVASVCDCGPTSAVPFTLWPGDCRVGTSAGLAICAVLVSATAAVISLGLACSRPTNFLVA
eukprot:UC1_evm2s1766